MRGRVGSTGFARKLNGDIIALPPSEDNAPGLEGEWTLLRVRYFYYAKTIFKSG